MLLYGVGRLVDRHQRRAWENRVEVALQDIRKIADFAAMGTAAQTAILQQFPAARDVQPPREDRKD
jgi:hypothetical protein